MGLVGRIKRCAGRAAARMGQGRTAARCAPRGASHVNVTQLDNGASARVMELRGGGSFTGKLKAMGIVPGATVTKKGASFLRGPIVLEKGLTQVAIGYAMALRVIVQPCEPRK